MSDQLWNKIDRTNERIDDLKWDVGQLRERLAALESQAGARQGVSESLVPGPGSPEWTAGAERESQRLIDEHKARWEREKSLPAAASETPDEYCPSCDAWRRHENHACLWCGRDNTPPPIARRTCECACQTMAKCDCRCHETCAENCCKPSSSAPAEARWSCDYCNWKQPSSDHCTCCGKDSPAAKPVVAEASCICGHPPHPPQGCPGTSRGACLCPHGGPAAKPGGETLSKRGVEPTSYQGAQHVAAVIGDQIVQAERALLARVRAAVDDMRDEALQTGLHDGAVLLDEVIDILDEELPK